MTAVLVEGDGECVEVVGESFYRDALNGITGRQDREHIRQPVIAALVPEPSNPYDSNAVAIYVEEQKVGHLSRDDAIAYQPVVNTLAAQARVVACHARICGREGTPNLGVFMDLPSPEDVAMQLDP